MTQSLKLFIAIIFILSNCYVSMGDNRYPEIPLWPEGGVPDEPENIKEREKPTTVDSVGKMRIAYVDRPTLTVYPAQKEKANGTGVIICPGGGYNILAWTHEGIEICLLYTSPSPRDLSTSRMPSSA